MDGEHTLPPHRGKRVSNTNAGELRAVNDQKQADTTQEHNPTQAQDGTPNSAAASVEKARIQLH